MNAQTSDKISSIAARYVNLTSARLLVATRRDSTLEETAADIRSMAASLLRQDESRGIRKLLRKLTGR